MSFLDALIGAHTNAATSAAAADGANWLWQTTSTADNTIRNARDKSAGYLTTGANGATGAINQGYGNAQGAIAAGGQAGQNILQGRTDQGVNTALSGNASLDPYASAGGGALTMLMNAYGLNGQSGNDAATAAFKASPGYGFQVSQATDAASRAAAAQGMSGSGNTLDAITRLGSNLADQEYGNWKSGLQNQATLGLTAANAQGANTRAAATLQGTAGSTGGQLAQLLGTSLGSSYQGQGTALGTIDTGLGANLANNENSAASSVANNDINTSRLIYNGSMGAAERQDAADSANNGILSGIIGSLGKGILNMPSISSGLGGFKL